MRPAPIGSNCPGVDINRNFPLGYGVGADSNPCSEVSFIHSGFLCYSGA